MGVTQPYVRPLIRVMANEFLNSLGWDFRMVAVRTIRLGVIRPAFCRHPEAIIHGNDRGVYEQQQTVHGRVQG